MKLALLYLSKGGAIANCTYEIAKALSKEHEVTCYMSSENQLLYKFEDLPCTVKTYKWKRGKLNLAIALLSLKDTTGIAESVVRDCPDLVIDAGSWWWRGIVFRGLKNKVPIAEIVHDPTPHPGSMQLFYNLHHRLFPSKADIAIALSNYCYKELANKYSRQHHICSKHGMMISSDDINSSRIADLRRKLLFFGRIEPYKGIDDLVDAYSIAKQSIPDIELTVAGEGKLDPAVVAKIKSSDIKLINEFIPEDQIQDLILSHGLMVLPYTYATQSGVAAVALANGLPCVATDVGALPEQIQHGRNGFIVEPHNPQQLADAIVKIANDYELAKKMSEESCIIGHTEYSWDEITKTLVADLNNNITVMKKRTIDCGGR